MLLGNLSSALINLHIRYIKVNSFYWGSYMFKGPSHYKKTFNCKIGLRFCFIKKGGWHIIRVVACNEPKEVLKYT